MHKRQYAVFVYRAGTEFTFCYIPGLFTLFFGACNRMAQRLTGKAEDIVCRVGRIVKKRETIGGVKDSVPAV